MGKIPAGKCHMDKNPRVNECPVNRNPAGKCPVGKNPAGKNRQIKILSGKCPAGKFLTVNVL